MTAEAVRTQAPALWFSTLTSRIDPAYQQRALVSGHGVFLRDVSGREYLDARSMLWNAALGYGYRPVADAITGQLQQLGVGQMIRFEQPPQIALDYAERLVAALPDTITQVRFCTTGAQAVEGAVMLSRFVRRHDEPQRRDVIALWDGYHGIGGLASGLTGEKPLHAIEGRTVRDVHHVAAGDIEQLLSTIERVGSDRITAVLLEPILGTGFVELSASYLQQVQKVCRERGIHLIVDEVTTGFGRTGTLTVSGRLGLEPDMILLSKGITAGYMPLSAIAVNQEIATRALDSDVVFPHGSTCDGHPLALAAADAVLTAFADGKIFDNVVERGAQLMTAVQKLATELPIITGVHGRGLMIAVELAGTDGATMTTIKDACRDSGLLVALCGDLVLLTPPLIITAAEVDTLTDRLAAGIRAAL
ncbi:aminotransferase class III-fold pyridoxal phosphate-dependent enzyme [Actinoplanes sp. HUAS TT8]|uniref:aminotransferase class III-fold pyridoxal phosphate-dependent enzyme n=1 Tax=Actinoplanes sp. HUAS TT8 TaxID=3447453 RepID=UPI003F51B46A